MAEQDCVNTVDCENSRLNSPIRSVPKRLRSSPTFCTPHRKEKRIPLRELVANEASNEVPRMSLFDQSSANATSEGGSSNSSSAQMVKYFMHVRTYVFPFKGKMD